MDLTEALAFLHAHENLEAAPARVAASRLERARRLLQFLGDPHRCYPVFHLTGTNGKTSTARILTSLLAAKGLSVGSITSPHLERVNERISWGDEPIGDDALTEIIEQVAAAEPLLGEDRPSYFEILVAAGFRWLADVAVDAAVVEVGLGGRYDATNVADGQVAVVTNVRLDHAEVIGPSLEDIAREKAGIVKSGSILVLGETDPDIAAIFRDGPADEVWERDIEFGCTANGVAHGGRILDMRTPAAAYEGLYLPLHGAHQGDNAACALAAAEAFFASPLSEEVVREAFTRVRSPGRLEVVGRQPLLLLDGAHNPDGARALTQALDHDFASIPDRILVVGMFRERDPHEMLRSLDAQRARLVIACPAPSPRALPAETIAAAADDLGVAAEVTAGVGQAVALALALAEPEEMVVVTGSLYVVGAARTLLAHGPGQ